MTGGEVVAQVNVADGSVETAAPGRSGCGGRPPPATAGDVDRFWQAFPAQIRS